MIGAKNGTRTRDPDLGKVVLYQLSYFRIFASQKLFCDSFNKIMISIGAKNGTRTRDPDLGKVVLYQLSYFRVFQSISFDRQPVVFPIALQR